MSSHIYQCKRVTLYCAVKMLSLYKGLLKLGVLQKDAKGEACYQMETGRQSASHLRCVRKPNKKCTAYKDPKYVKGFDHVCLATVGAVPKGKDLSPRSNTEACILRLFSKHRPDVYAKMMQAKVNFKRVTGRPVKRLTRWLINNQWQQWVKIKRGRDLFVKGWGSFDITNAVANCEFNPHVHILQAQGYKIQGWVLERILKEKPNLVKWIAKYKDWFWCEDKTLRSQRLARFDELWRHAESEYRGISLENTPEQFFAEVDRLEREFENQVDGPTIDYDWLQKIPDVPTEVGIIKPLRSTTELVQAGKDLHNCAKHYNQRIAEQLSAILVCTDETGKPLAMAEITEMDSPQGPLLSQVSGVCNSPVSPEIEQAFTNCMKGVFSSNV